MLVCVGTPRCYVFVRLPLQREVVKHVPGLWGQWFGLQPTSQMARISRSLSSFFSSLFFPLSTSPTLVFLKHAFCKWTNECLPKNRGCCVVLSVTVYVFSSITHTCDWNVLERTKTWERKIVVLIVVFSKWQHVFSTVSISCQIMTCFLAG